LADSVGVRRRCAAASAVPIAVCAVLALAFAYDAPYWDDWMFVAPIAKAFDGTLGLSDFVVHVNEHVYVTPNFITIPLARLTHWNIRAEIAVTLLFYLATFALFVGQLRKAAPSGSLWAAPAIALALFSFSQHAVWNWGLHVSLAMAVFFAVIALRLLSNARMTVQHLGWAISAGWAATFSIGGGLAVWVAGAMVLWLLRFETSRGRWAALAVWLVAGTLASGVYVATSPASPGEIRVGIGDAVSVVVYAVAFLGGPLAAFSGGAAVCAGAVLVAAYCIAVRRGGPTFALGLMALAVTAGLLTALKHEHEGIENAISSRFLPWGTLAWCGLALLVYAKWPTIGAMPRGVRAVVAAAVAGVFASSCYGMYKAEERHDAFLLGRRALIEDPASADMKFIHPQPETLQERRELLIKHRLTVFREDAE